MLLATAQTAGTLASQIAATNAQVAKITALLASNSIITSGDLSVQDGSTNQIITQQILTLTISESATVFNSMLTVLNARLTAWNATLSGM